MGFDKKKIKQIRQLMLLAAVLILGLIYSQEVFNAISMLAGIMKPFIYGGVIAFVLNIPLYSVRDFTDYDCHCNSCSAGCKDCYGAGK